MKTSLLTVAALLTFSCIGTVAADPAWSDLAQTDLARSDLAQTDSARLSTAGAPLLLDAGQLDTVTAGAGLQLPAPHLPALQWDGGECAMPMLNAQLPQAGVRPTGAAADGSVRPSLHLGGGSPIAGGILVIIVAAR
jgi:hypothetical protein